MATLADSFAQDGEATAVIIPEIPALWNVTYEQLQAEVTRFQAKLAEVGIQHGDVVSIAFPNTYEFIISFLAATSQRAIAAPLNPAYKQDEFEFYIGDLNSTLALVPQGWFNRSEACVRAARTFNVAIAECYWDGNEIVLDLKERGKLEGTASQELLKAEPDDIALVLHTSGTTGRPKSVRVITCMLN
jgi:acyl-coenzyme A synthetase/AMP-(fatty) acid ligase